ncbi:MAG: multidrug effflux MFS transporter [Chthoniobacterales bacterium]
MSGLSKALKSSSLLPAVWLIIALAGISQLSETVYTPSLPAIARTFHAKPSIVEYTLAIFFLGFALGTLFFGKISDHFGRKPCMLVGLLIFVLGSLGCYYSGSIMELMGGRLLQAFGASIGSVLVQALVRDVLSGPALGKMYSFVGSSLSLFPIIGPILGVFIDERFGWHAIFLLLSFFGFFLIISVMVNVKETHHQKDQKPVSFITVAGILLRDKKVMTLAFILAATHGISYSYFAEGSFYFIELLKLAPRYYGLTFIFLAIGMFLGGMLSLKLNNIYTSGQVMDYGLKIVFGGALFFSSVMLLHAWLSFSREVLIVATVASQTIIVFGICMTITNALAIALVDYKWCVGTASSLLGFFYCSGTSLFTFGMGTLHNKTVYAMPFYFLGISILTLLVRIRSGERIGR